MSTHTQTEPRRITDLFAERDRTFSFEFFPPKTPAGVAALYRTCGRLVELDGPDFVSVTYGAGGSTSKATLAIITELQRRYGITCMHHFTLVGQSRDELVEHIHAMRRAGVRNVLALRGDPVPEMGERFHVAPGGLEYCYELIDLIRRTVGDWFSIGVAGFPEGHVDCPSKRLDTEYLKIKVDHGAEFVITQLFFEGALYSEYLDRTHAAGVDVRIIPGVLVVTDYEKLLRFCHISGATIPSIVRNTFAPLREDPAALQEAGIEFAVRQCDDLLARGAPGLHFYCLNKTEPARTIWKAVVGQ